MHIREDGTIISKVALQYDFAYHCMYICTPCHIITFIYYTCRAGQVKKNGKTYDVHHERHEFDPLSKIAAQPKHTLKKVLVPAFCFSRIMFLVWPSLSFLSLACLFFIDRRREARPTPSTVLQPPNLRHYRIGQSKIKLIFVAVVSFRFPFAFCYLLVKQTNKFSITFMYHTT